MDAGEIVFATVIPGAQMRRSGNHLNYQLQEFTDFLIRLFPNRKKILTGIRNNLQKNKSIALVALSKTSC